MFSRKGFWNFVIVSIRIFLGYIFFSAGMAKLLDGQFPGIIGPVWLEERLAEYGLGLFARFIAFSQVIVGLLVLSQRFATVGAVMLFPIITTTLMVTISLEWRGTPYVLGFFLLLNAILLLADYHKLKFLLTDQPAVLKTIPLTRKSLRSDFLWGIGVLFIISSIFIYDLNKAMTYIMVIAGMLIFIGSWILKNRKAHAESII
ncbi:MAG: hypothetical protein SFU99_24445 [Saprospiraceae bacterium]|nr:hypothetical protein [Saprospiraceae bacterium]